MRGQRLQSAYGGGSAATVASLICANCERERSALAQDLEVRHAALVEMTHGGGLRFDVLKRGLALRASALRLAAIAANQFDVAYDSVGAQMCGDG